MDGLPEFMSLTGADAVAAESYLEMSRGSVEAAVELFFQMGGSSAGGGGSAGLEGGGEVAGSSFADYAPDNAAGGGGGGYGGPLPLQHQHFDDFAGGGGEDVVRAPEASKHERLLGDAAHYQANSQRSTEKQHQVHAFRDFSREADYAALQRAKASSSSAAGAAKGDNGGGGRHGNGNAKGAVAAVAKAAEERSLSKKERLADLFRPPLEIMHQGSFNDAKADAKSKRKWLMVNIQNDTEFASHRLNRDTWGNETVQMMLESLVVFWQQYENSTEGARYCERYKVAEGSHPHVALLDPRTGLSVWSRSGFMSAEMLSDKISDFCGKHSLEEEDGDDDDLLLSPAAKKQRQQQPQQELPSSSSSSPPSSSLPQPPSSTSTVSASESGGGNVGGNVLGGSSSSSSSSGEITNASGSCFTGGDREGVAGAAGAMAAVVPLLPAEEFREVDVGEEPSAGDASSTRVQFTFPPSFEQSLLCSAAADPSSSTLPSSSSSSSSSSCVPQKVTRRFPSLAPVAVLFKFAHEHMLKMANEAAAAQATQATAAGAAATSDAGTSSAAVEAAAVAAPCCPAFDIKTCAPPVQSLRRHLNPSVGGVVASGGSGGSRPEGKEAVTLADAGVTNARIAVSWL